MLFFQFQKDFLLLLEYFARFSYAYSASVFRAEADLGSSALLTQPDIVHILGLKQSPFLQETIANSGKQFCLLACQARKTRSGPAQQLCGQRHNSNRPWASSWPLAGEACFASKLLEAVAAVCDLQGHQTSAPKSERGNVHVPESPPLALAAMSAPHMQDFHQACQVESLKATELQVCDPMDGQHLCK